MKDTPKMIRESLCVAQAALIQVESQGATDIYHHVERLERLINLIDLLRPLGQDGKHDGRHTAWCGCEDK